MPLGFLPYHPEAADITKLGADMRVSYQSERLSGTGSLLQATNTDMDPTLNLSKVANKNKWFFPLAAIAGFAILAGVFRK